MIKLNLHRFLLMAAMAVFSSKVALSEAKKSSTADRILKQTEELMRKMAVPSSAPSHHPKASQSPKSNQPAIRSYRNVGGDKKASTRRNRWGYADTTAPSREVQTRPTTNRAMNAPNTFSLKPERIIAPRNGELQPIEAATPETLLEDEVSQTSLTARGRLLQSALTTRSGRKKSEFESNREIASENSALAALVSDVEEITNRLQPKKSMLPTSQEKISENSVDLPTTTERSAKKAGSRSDLNAFTRSIKQQETSFVQFVETEAEEKKVTIEDSVQKKKPFIGAYNIPSGFDTAHKVKTRSALKNRRLF